MGPRDQRNHQQNDDWRDADRQQMGQYAAPYRQYGDQRDDGSRQTRDWGSQRGGSDLSRHDPAQSGYGRASAPDVHGAPSGGYQRDWRADAGYNQPGYMRDAQRDDRRGGYDEGRDWNRGRDEQRHGGGEERYQGGSGGYQSNSGPYAGSQTYGGYGDQLGYGSYQGGGQRHGQHHDHDYQQWREQQLRNLDDDYHSWRGERYQKFSEEFDSWRKKRQSAELNNDLPGSAGGDIGKNSGTK